MHFRNLCIALLCLCSISSIAQPRYHYYKSYSSMGPEEQQLTKKQFLGISFPMMSINAANHYVPNTQGQPAVGDTSFSLRKNSHFGIGFILGNFVHLKEMGDGGELALEIAFKGDYCYWKIPAIPHFGDVQNNQAEFGCYSLPLTLMYKGGAEALLSPNIKYMYSAGIGVEPYHYSFTYLSMGQKAWSARPLLMAEGGIYAGMAMKLRATYYPLHHVYCNATSTDDNGSFSAKVTGGGNLVISFILMTGSQHWGD